MLNLSRLVRNSKQTSLVDKLKGCVGPEIYIAENIADYKHNKTVIVSPWFKRANDYAFVVFYNVGIDGIFGENVDDDEKKNSELIGNLVNVHDESGFEMMYWTEKGNICPARESYFEMLGNFELEVKDLVYQLIVRYIYDGNVSFVADVTKSKCSNEKKVPLMERVNRLLHDCK